MDAELEAAIAASLAASAGSGGGTATPSVAAVGSSAVDQKLSPKPTVTVTTTAVAGVMSLPRNRELTNRQPPACHLSAGADDCLSCSLVMYRGGNRYI